MERNPEIVVLGGGPAGAVAAATLARKGRSVLVLEKDLFPRFHIGESMLPASLPLLRRLGVEEKMRNAGFIVKHGARITSGCGRRDIKIYFRNGYRNTEPTTYQVTRSHFDKLLLDHARECGATVRTGCTVRGVEFLEEGGVELRFQDDQGALHSLQAPWVIDATGRSSLIGQKFGLKKRYHGLNKFSVFAHFENCHREEGIDGGLTHMVRTSDRWFWLIPLTATRTSVGVVCDHATFKSANLSPEEFLEHNLAAQPEVGRWLENARRDTPVYAAGDYSYRNQKLTGPGWILAGDAAGFIDPVFSTGVFIGLDSGERAAMAVERQLATGGDPTALRAYEKDLRRIFDLYLSMVRNWYRNEFMEIFLYPVGQFQLAPTVNALLAGQHRLTWGMRFRLGLVFLLARVQRFFPLNPRLTFEPSKKATPAVSGKSRATPIPAHRS